eukprot:2730089-Pyramimonas_sp.AAC.1
MSIQSPSRADLLRMSRAKRPFVRSRTRKGSSVVSTKFDRQRQVENVKETKKRIADKQRRSHRIIVLVRHAVLSCWSAVLMWNAALVCLAAPVCRGGLPCSHGVPCLSAVLLWCAVMVSGVAVDCHAR